MSRDILTRKVESYEVAYDVLPELFIGIVLGFMSIHLIGSLVMFIEYKIGDIRSRLRLS
ncbi:hypothetical protein BDK61_2870 [Haloarcula quadrata]|uniref:Uncharacterized protein n=1 Tax=Haloarcula quadrata TaxID=182779 RepID=A0A495R873_9EURY|nr:hypothetical protein BDK61_2870 [Haloarcula quadrata]